MQKAGAPIPMWTIGVLLMVPLGFGLNIAHVSQPVSSTDVAVHEKRFSRSAATAGTSVVGLRGYRRYHANTSFIGQPMPCTHEEKMCFSFNLLFDESKKWCVDLETHYANFSSGHVIATVRKKFKCDGYVMAYDDKCYRRDVVQNVICGCGAKPSPHVFMNGMECRCPPTAPIHVEQPSEEGRCRVPDLRFPNRAHFFRNPHHDIQGFTSNHKWVNESIPLQFSCSKKQRNCFTGKKVWMLNKMARARQRERGLGTCRKLLENGDCPEEHVVALDVQAAREGRVETTCVHERGGCPKGQVLMPFDNKCHSEKDIRSITNGKLFRNHFGFFVITPQNIHSLTLEPMTLKNKMCAFLVDKEFVSVHASEKFFPIINPLLEVNVSKPPCPSVLD